MHFLDWCLSTVASLCGTTISFACVYYPLYIAAEKGTTLMPIGWRVHMSCAVFWSLLTASGLPFLGHYRLVKLIISHILAGHANAGIWNVISLMHAHHHVMAFAFFTNTLLWLFLLTFQCHIWKAVHLSASRQLPSYSNP